MEPADQIVTIRYKPLIKGNSFHSRQFRLTVRQLYGTMIMAYSLYNPDINARISIILDDTNQIDINSVLDLPYFNYTYEYSAQFNNITISFDNREIIQGAVQICVLFGIDPSTVITNVQHNNQPTGINFGRYYIMVPFTNTSPYPDGTIVEFDDVRLQNTELVNSLENMLNSCFENENVGVSLPGDVYAITIDPTRTNVIATCYATPYAPPSYAQYDGAHFISNVCTSSDVRGYGLSKSILVSMLNDKISEGINRFVLGVDPDNTIAYRLYTELGFEKVETIVEYGGDMMSDMLTDVLLLSFD